MTVNLPNGLTLARIALTAVFMAVIFYPSLTAKLAAIALFLLASLTDYWDGRIARESGRVTEFGKLMDPIADKILALSAFTAFVQLGVIPAWMLVVIVLREIAVTGYRFAPNTASVDRSATMSGKYKTVLQFSAIFLVLIYLCIASDGDHEPILVRLRFLIHILMWAVTVVTVWSGVDTVMGMRVPPRPMGRKN